MNTVRRSTPSGFVIFCDDVRTEANGKFIYIGIYGGDILISPHFPIRLPTFCAVVNYFARHGESSDPVRILIQFPGKDEPHAELEIPASDIAALPPPDDPDLEDPVFQMTLVLAMRDVVMAQPGRIKVYARRGEDEIRLGSIAVRLNPALTGEQEKKDEAAN